MLRGSPARGLVAAAIAYILLWLVTPRIGVPASFPWRLLAGVASTCAFMAVQIAIVYFYAALNWKWWQSLVALVVCLGSAIIIAQAMRALAGPKGAILTYYGLLRIPYTLLLIIAAASIGCAVAERVKDRNLLLPVVMFAAYIDFWTVTRGPVAAILQHAPNVAQAVSAPIPRAGTGSFTPASMIGPGDFLFMGLVFAAVSRLKMNGKRNYWAVFAMMTLGMLAVVVGPLEFLPALIVLAVAVIVANWGEFKLTRQEAISMAIVGVLLLGSLPLIWRALAPRPEKKPQTKPPVAAPVEGNRPRTN